MIDSWTSSISVDCEEEEEDGDHEERIEEKVGRHRIGTISLYTLHAYVFSTLEIHMDGDHFSGSGPPSEHRPS